MGTIKRKLSLSRFANIYIGVSMLTGFLLIVIDSSMIAPFLMHMGASAVQVGLMDSFVAIAVAISNIFAVYLLYRVGNHKRAMIYFTFFSFLALLCLAVFVPFMTAGAVVIFVIMMVFLFHSSYGLTALPMNDMYRIHIPEKSRVRFMSTTHGLLLFVVAGGGFMIKWLLDHPRVSFASAYYILFAVTASLMLLILLTYCFLPKSTPLETQAEPSRLFHFYRMEFQKLRHDRNMVRFFGVVFLFSLMWSSTGLYFSFGYRTAAADMEAMLGTGIFLRLLIKGIAFLAAGSLAARYGNRTVLFILTILGMSQPIIILFFPFHFFILVIIITNLIPMCYVYLLNYLFANCDEGQFKGKFVLLNIVPLPSALLMPLLGYVLENSVQWFGILMACIAAANLYMLIKLRHA